MADYDLGAAGVEQFVAGARESTLGEGALGESVDGDGWLLTVNATLLNAASLLEEQRIQTPPVLSGKPMSQQLRNEELLGLSRRITVEVAAAAERQELARYHALGENPVGLAHGTAGVALALAILARAHGIARVEETARKLFIFSVDHAGQLAGVGLHNGVTGLALVSRQIADILDDAELGRPAQEIETFLIDSANEGKLACGFDFTDGLAGVGTYLARHVAGGRVDKCLQRIAQRLEASAVEDELLGLRWPEDGDKRIDEAAPVFAYNLGMAHGSAGVVGYLALVAERIPGDGRIRDLLQRAVESLVRGVWYRRRLFEPRREGRTPVCKPSWCWGDLGIAIAVARAGKVVGRAAWVVAAVEMARESASWTRRRARIQEASLCHGSAGTALLFRSLYQHTGEAAFHEAADRWLYYALEQSDSTAQDTFGGYLFAKSQADNPQVWMGSPGVLIGSLGIALSYVALVNGVDGSWETALLLGRAR